MTAPLATSPAAEAIARVEAALTDLRDGRFVVVTEGEGEAMQGDLVMAAAAIAPEAVVFMAGLGPVIRVCLPERRCEELGLFPIAPRFDSRRWTTAMAVTIEAASGVSTGISAADRARTIAVAADPASTEADLVKPGHIVPLIARQGGVIARAGRTEAAVDLPSLAGMSPAGVDCDILTADGEPARGEELAAFCREHGIRRVGVADVVAYRLTAAPLVERIESAALPGTTAGGGLVTYREAVSGRIHVAAVGATGSPATAPATHRYCVAGEFAGSGGCGCAGRFAALMDGVRAGARGLVLCLDFGPVGMGAEPMGCVRSRPDAPLGDARRTSVTEQILRDLAAA